jgi:hypothetical protein
MRFQRCLPVVLAALLLAAGTAGPFAQEPAPARQPGCGSEPLYQQFDFWLGDWDVESGGKKAGTNRIEKILGGCVLLESWTGTGGSRGQSFNYYDDATKEWVQVWVDASGGSITCRGGLRDGAMHLEGEHTHKDGHIEPFRMTFTPNPDGSVRQFIEQSKDNGKTWYVWFDGLYTRGK